MSYRTNEDNIYPVGLHIRAHAHPTVALVINSYYQRIYYCSEIDNPATKEKAYFERELIPPVG